jgi:hypothetical protein
VVTEAITADGRQPRSVEMVVGTTKGGVSGGTLSTMCALFDQGMPALKKTMHPVCFSLPVSV